MCGICGIINLDRTVPVDRQIVQDMCDTMRHRGPDDEGFFTDRNVGMGMRRLSIIDLGGGRQPIYNEAKTVCVFLNGEIYNYRELRQQLEQLDHRFGTDSDTEVIVHAYEQWGEACPKKLHGMFTFAIWDKSAERLFIARDRLGKKPLYYCVDGDSFYFASEIKSILRSARIPRRLNLQALDSFLSLGYVPAPQTLFEGIFKLPAGHALSLSNGNYRVNEYWDFQFAADKPLGLTEYSERLQSLLEQAVRVRLMSEVPLGAFLSGGIDSGIVVGLMSRLMSVPVDTFSVGFNEHELNELQYARVIADYFATNHHELLVNNCPPDLIERLVWHLDEPLADPAIVPTYLVSELARKDVTVVLTGEGGDELFAGYDYYRWARDTRSSGLLPESLKRRTFPSFARGVNTLLGRPRYHERTMWFWSLPPGRQMAAWVAIFTDAEKHRLYHPTFRHRLREDSATAIFDQLASRSRTTDYLHQMMYIDTKMWLPDDLLMKVDKMSMATSIEARTPFLDHKLLEFVATIPSSFKLNGSTSKYILKEVAKGILPDNILNRPKHPFHVPLRRWMKSDLRELIGELIECGIVAGENLFDKTYIREVIWRGLEEGRSGHDRQLFALLNLGLWVRQYAVQVA